jgi:hypothetical protein
VPRKRGRLFGIGRVEVRKVTPKTLPTVWLKLTAHVAATVEHPEAAKAFCDDLNDFLDRLWESDAFGTEGQLDPRGDHRG